MSDNRPKRRCELCHQIDDHPRMQVLDSNGSIIEAHHDCHADNGNKVAKKIVKLAKHKQGDELLSVLQSGSVNI